MGCTVAPKTDSPSGSGNNKEKNKLISLSNRHYAELKSKGLIHHDTVIQDYVADIGFQLLSDSGEKHKFRFYVLREPSVNASADAAGRIYIHLGLLTRIENEDQLAFVIGHEISHVLRQHPERQLHNRKVTMVTGHVMDLLLGGIGFGYIPTVFDMLRYSRSQEFDADQQSMKLLRQAGYDFNQGIRAIELINEVKSVESIPGSLYSTHPTNTDRIKRLRLQVYETNNRNRTAKAKISQFSEMRSRIMADYLPLKLSRKRYELTLDTLRRELEKGPENPMLHYYLGEAHRKIAEDPSGAAREHVWLYGKSNTVLDDVEKQFKAKAYQEIILAEQAYRKALDLDPNYWKAYRGLGLIARGRGDSSLARKHLMFYLEKGDRVKDKRYIKGILRNLEFEHD